MDTLNVASGMILPLPRVRVMRKMQELLGGHALFALQPMNFGRGPAARHALRFNCSLIASTAIRLSLLFRRSFLCYPKFCFLAVWGGWLRPPLASPDCSAHLVGVSWFGCQGAVSSSRPDVPRTSRTAAVKDGLATALARRVASLTAASTAPGSNRSGITQRSDSLA